MKILFVACALALATPLAGCNRAAEAASGAPQADLPMIAAGKWEEKHAYDGDSWGMPTKRCQQQRTLWDVMEVGVAGLKSCERTIEQTAGGFIAQYQCKSGGSAITIKTTVKGDLKRRFTVDSVQTFEPALNGTKSQKISIVHELHAPC